MRHFVRCAAICMSAALEFASPSYAASTQYPHFRVDELAPGVYAVIQKDPLGLANHANSVFIVGDKDVIVVDSQFTLTRTREVLAAIRAVTDKPVGMLINTHWHDDHTFGNQVYVEAFPEVDIVAHLHTQTDMKSVGVENRKNQVAGAPDGIKMFRAAIDTKTAVDGTPMSDDERAAYESTLAIVHEYLDDMPQFTLTLPTKTFETSQMIQHGDRLVEILYTQPAVTRGDIAVYLPRDGILITGDLFDNPVPFAYHCNVSGWIESLANLSGLKYAVAVPGHGEPVGPGRIEQSVFQLISIRDQAEKARSRGESLDVFRAGVSLQHPEVKGKMMEFLFQNYFVGPAATSAFNEAADSKG